MTLGQNQSDFNFIFLGQSVLKYQVPLDVYQIINHIYETKYPELKLANKQLVGKIEKEHSLFFNGDDGPKMTRHNHLPDNVLSWFESKFKHYLDWNKIKNIIYILILFGLTPCLNMNTIQCMCIKELYIQDCLVL